MARKSVQRFSDKAMRKIKARMIPKTVRRFSDQIVRQIKTA
jgi:hypothetical protein